MLLVCPHCDDVIEVLGEPKGLTCDCGGLLELAESEVEERARHRLADSILALAAELAAAAAVV